MSASDRHQSDPESQSGISAIYYEVIMALLCVMGA